MDNFGFIMLRHVNNKSTNKYWVHCYECIRKFHAESHILIIDDNSNYEFITDKTLYKTTVINSEFHGRGEVLPYYYYLRNKLFDAAVIIHDSVFINKPIDFSTTTYKMLWTFEHFWDQIEDETVMIEMFQNPELMTFYKNKNAWEGCFGGMCVITHDYLLHINAQFEIQKLLGYVKTRYNRCSFERVIACILQKDIKTTSLLGNIHKYCRWEISFEDREESRHLPLIKIWTGR